MDFGGFSAMAPGIPPPIGTMTMIPKLTRIMRRNVDYTSSVIAYLEDRIWQRGKRDKPMIQPDLAYVSEMVAPVGSNEDPVTAITTKFVKTVYNKQRCPIFCTSWAPDGRRLIAGAASGEFSLWNGINLNFEALMKSHDSSVRSMQWSHNAMWMVTTDDKGVVKYWQSNMNNVHSFQAHNETIRGCSFSPMDAKLATCSDDGTVRVFDVLRSSEEFILRGHGADVKCVDWHPRKNLLVSGSKDNQQPIKLWDPKAGQSISTIHAHKAAVTCVKWNRNGNWLLTASRDHLIKLYDIRTMKEMEVLKGHKADVNTVSWHPVHEKLFASGGSEGAILFWLVGNKRDIGGMESPHDSFVWSLSWHPLGHMLCSGSNDHTCKFWCRNRPGDEMKDRHSSGGVPVEEMADSDIFDNILPNAVVPSNKVILPAPSKTAMNIPPSAAKAPWTVGQTRQAEKPPVPNVEFPLQVLGADIIKEQFGKPLGGPAQDQDIPPAKSGLFMHQQGGETKEGGQTPQDLVSPLSNPQQNPPQLPPSGPPTIRGPTSNFPGPRPPPMQQNRRDWHEGDGDFPGRPHYPPHEFPHRHHGMRPTHLSSNPFSWQRQDPSRDRAFEEEGGRFPNEQGHNPYVYRREEGSNRLRDPREQRMHPGMEESGRDDPRRLSQDEPPPGWPNRGPLGWRQERGDHPPDRPHPHFHNQESKPPTQEHFDWLRGDFGPPGDHDRDRRGNFPPGGPPPVRQGMDHHIFREGDNWHHQFGRDRPPHEGPQQNFPQERQQQRPGFPPELANFPPHSSEMERHLHSDNDSNNGPPLNTPPGNVQLPEQQRGPGGPPNDPRSQRAPVPPTSQPQRPPQHAIFHHEGGPPQLFSDGPSRTEDPPLQHESGPHQTPRPQQLSPRVHDSGPPIAHGGPPPHIHDAPPLIPPQGLSGPPLNPAHGPPQSRDGPPLLPPQGPPHASPQFHGGPPQMQPPPRDGPQQMQPPPCDGPQQMQLPPRDGPQQMQPPPRDGPPQMQPPPRDGPPQMQPPPRDGPQLMQPPPRDGTQQMQPPRDGPPQMQPPPHDGPPQMQPPPRDGPPQMQPPPRDGPPQMQPPPHDGPLQMQPPHHDGPPHGHDGPPPLQPQSRDGPLHMQPQPHDGPQRQPLHRLMQHPQHMHGGPPQSHDVSGPPQHPQQLHSPAPPQDGPSQNRVHDGPQHPQHGPPQSHEGPAQHPQQGALQHPQQALPPHSGPLPTHGGPPQQGPLHHGGPPQSHDGPPQQGPPPHDGPPQQGPPPHGGLPQSHDGPPQQGPPHGPPSRGPPQSHDAFLQHPQYGPPIHANSPQHVTPQQRFEELHGQQQNFFPPQLGGQSSPHHVESPVTSQPHQYISPHTGPPETAHGGPPPPQRFPGPHPPHFPREPEHFHSPQHFQEQQGPPPGLQGPPPPQFSGPPSIQREPHFLSERPPHGGPPPGPTDPRRQHPPPGFHGGPPDRGFGNNPDGDRFPPRHPHHHGPPHRSLEGPPDSSWDHRQHHNAFPRDNRFEGNRDSHDRRSSGSRGEGREGRDNRDRDRDRDRGDRGDRIRGSRDRSPKHHRDGGPPPAKRSRSDRDSSSKHGRREKRK